MSEITIAMKAGLLEENYLNLINGIADNFTAGKFGVMAYDLQNFIDGEASVTMALKLGIVLSDLQLLRNNIGRPGAIGFLLGVLIRNN